MATKIRRNRRGIPQRAKTLSTAQLIRRKDSSGQTFRARMQELRKDMTVEEFAARCGAPVTTAREWLNAGVPGRKSTGVLPSAEYLYAISDALGVTIDWILGRPGAPKYPDQRRTDATLAEDLAAYLGREALVRLDHSARLSWPPGTRAHLSGGWSAEHEREHVYAFLGGGEQVLKYLVDDVTSELRAKLIAARSYAERIDRTINTLAEMMGKEPDRETYVQLYTVLWDVVMKEDPVGRFVRAPNQHDR